MQIMQFCLKGISAKFAEAYVAEKQIRLELCVTQ